MYITTIKKVYLTNSRILPHISLSLVFVCVTLISCSQIVFSQGATESTTVMRNYQDPVHGIQLQYPPNWTPSTSAIPSYNGIVAFYSPLQNLSDILPAEITLSITTYSQAIPLNEYTQVVLSALEQQGIKVDSSGSKTLAGKEGYSITFVPNSISAGPYTQSPSQSQEPPTFKVMQTWTAIDNKVYLMSFTAEILKFDTNLATAEKIFGSLKITPK
jgi:hypothetical protein